MGWLAGVWLGICGAWDIIVKHAYDIALFFLIWWATNTSSYSRHEIPRGSEQIGSDNA
jgi:hypothetical protein